MILPLPKRKSHSNLTGRETLSLWYLEKLNARQNDEGIASDLQRDNCADCFGLSRAGEDVR